MGEVYRARDTRLDRTVAIKILPSVISADPIAKQRFEREAKTISSLNHPNICVLHDVGSQDGIEYLVMECVDGETLAKKLEKGPLPLEQALKIGREMAGALDKAHRSGVVHRDLKPGNVMLTATGAKLLDFGLAKPAAALASLATLTAVAPANSPVTQQGTIVGTFQYMSPEQVEGKELDGRSDIFSLGAVLYEMVTGKRAFQGKSQLSVASAILEKEPEALGAVKPTAPAALDRAIRRCLAKDPEERWQSASDLASELKWLAGDGSKTEALAQTAGNEKWNAGAAWMLATVLLALTAAGVTWWWKTPETKGRAYYASPFRLGANDLAISPDGRMTAIVAYWDPGNQYVIWTYRLGEASAAALEGTEGASHPFWSADGKWIGFFAQGKLKKVALVGKSVQVICDAPNGRGGTWNKDGVILFTPDVFTGIYRVAAEGGTAAKVTDLDSARAESSQRWPVFLPDGRHFIYLAANFSGHPENNGIFLGSLDTQEKRFLVAASSNAAYAEPGYLLYLRDGALVAQGFNQQNLAVKGEPEVVLRNIDYRPVVDLALFVAGPNGTVVAQTGSGGLESRLSWFDRGGKLLGNVGPPLTYANPSLSPDGKRLAFDQRSPERQEIGIWVYDLRTAVASKLTLDPSLNQAPVWTGDGKRIIFTSNRKIFNLVYQKNADGSGPETQITDLVGGRLVNCWDTSRDGAYMLLRSEAELWNYTVAEKKSRPYIQGKWLVRNAQFSPDGKWVAYSTNESGNWEVYVSPFPNASSKWQVSHGGGEEPRWRQDGKELFYLSPDGKLMAAGVKLGDSFEAMTSVPLFQARRRQKISSQDIFTYAVGENGTKFLFNTVVEQKEAQPLSVILNWNSGLEK